MEPMREWFAAKMFVPQKMGMEKQKMVRRLATAMEAWLTLGPTLIAPKTTQLKRGIPLAMEEAEKMMLLMFPQIYTRLSTRSKTDLLSLRPWASA